ncbi:hypothetical protein T06_11838 [Trichinella sp. T6]|nr:hypothetical protein T06_11838 [Trichinella sp. T6]
MIKFCVEKFIFTLKAARVGHVMLHANVNIIEIESTEFSCDARFRVQSLYCNIWLRLNRSKFVRFNESSKLVMNNNIERCEQHVIIVYTMISLQNHFQLSNKDFETTVEFNDHVKPRYQVIMPAKFLFIKGIRRCVFRCSIKE